MSGSGRRKIRLPQQDDHLDLVPLIDCVFLILLFFMLVGRLSTDQRTEQITVPPTKTATKFEDKKWSREVINIFGSTKDGDPPRNTIRVGNRDFRQTGVADFSCYSAVRAIFDKVYDKAEKYTDPKSGLSLPKVIVELRADADTEYRVVQEMQQVLTDTIDPNNKMQVKKVDPKNMKPFVNIDFTTRRPNDK
jgi:Biopolymer transport protein ExbD/TolR